MSVTRVHKSSNYTVMSNYHLRDKNISLKTRGLMSTMLSLPDEWDYSIKGLCAIVPDGEASVRTALKELERLGYLIRTPVRKNGRIIDWVYDIYEAPQDKSVLPLGDFPQVENPLVEEQHEELLQLNKLQLTKLQLTNPVQLNTKELNTKVLSTKEYKAEPSDLLKQALRDFKDMRKKIKAPLTDRAEQMLVKRLKELSKGDEALAIEILNQSTMNGWKSIYELKTQQLQPKQQPNNRFHNYEQRTYAEGQFEEIAEKNTARKLEKLTQNR